MNICFFLILSFFNRKFFNRKFFGFFLIVSFLPFPCEKITLFSQYGENPTFSKSRFFHTFFGEITGFSHFWRNHGFCTLCEKITVFSHFYRIPCFFQNFRVFKKIPSFKVRFRIPHKNSVCFSKIPRSESYRCYKFRGFSPENSVFYKIPRFSYFLNL